MFNSIKTTLRQMFLYPINLLKSHMQKTTVSKEKLAQGEGAIIEVNGKKTAVYKNDKGAVTLLSPVCPHLGCLVNWNKKDKVWDCPCHGSRFSKEGKVMKGPAKKNLASENVL